MSWMRVRRIASSSRSACSRRSRRRRVSCSRARARSRFSNAKPNAWTCGLDVSHGCEASPRADSSALRWRSLTWIGSKGSARPSATSRTLSCAMPRLACALSWSVSTRVRCRSACSRSRRARPGSRVCMSPAARLASRSMLHSAWRPATKRTGPAHVRLMVSATCRRRSRTASLPTSKRTDRPGRQDHMDVRLHPPVPVDHRNCRMVALRPIVNDGPRTLLALPSGRVRGQLKRLLDEQPFRHCRRL